MGRSIRFFLLSCSVLLLFGQCTVERRLYNKGFHIEKRGRFHSDQKTDKRSEEPNASSSEKGLRKSNHTVVDTLLNTSVQAEKNDGLLDELTTGNEATLATPEVKETDASSNREDSGTETSSPQDRKTDNSSDDVKNVLAIIFGTLAFFSLLGLILLLVILKNLGTVVIGESLLLILGIVFFAALTIIFLVVFLGLLLR